MNNFIIFILISLDTLKLDFETSYKIAILNNYDYKIETENENLKNILFYKSIFSYLPNLSISGTYTNTQRNLEFNPFSPYYSFTFEISQKIFSPVGIRNIINSFYSKSSQNFIKIEAKKKLFIRVLENYVEVLKSEKILKVLEKSLLRAEENFKIFEEKYKLGAISKLDYLNSNINLKNKKMEYEEALKNFDNKKWEFLLTLGFKEEKIVVLKDLEFKEEEISYEVEDFLKKLEERRELVLSIKEKKKSSFSDFLFTSLSFLPEIKWGYYITYQDTIFPKSYSYFKENFETSKGIYFSFGFKFFDYPFDVLSYKKNYDIEKIYLENTLLQIFEETRSAFNLLKLAKEKISLANSYLEAAKEAYNLAVAEYQLGKISYIEFLKAEENLIDGEMKLISSKYDYIKYKYMFLFLSGILEEVK
jgi:outer membrane protein TolC